MPMYWVFRKIVLFPDISIRRLPNIYSSELPLVASKWTANAQWLSNLYTYNLVQNPSFLTCKGGKR